MTDPQQQGRAAQDGVSPPVVALVFAGGVGSRMGGVHAVPKQFVEVAGRPILVHTLRHFERHERVSRVCVVTIDSYRDHVRELARSHGLSKVSEVVAGSDTACGSIYNGLRALAAAEPDERAVVLIHDGVRPAISADLIDRNIDGVLAHGTAISAIPAYETVALAAEDGVGIVEITDRHRSHILQAPQSFRLADVWQANQRAHADATIATFVDQAQLMRHYGHDLHMVTGLRGNVKLTVPVDIDFFTFLNAEDERADVIEVGQS